jgi:phosphoribosyl-ATP pyrophosphohydrolase/phosphoribosyl-AMP cyclohydrolase
VLTIDISRLHFDANGLIPAIVQDVASGRVRMLGYMNREALELTLSSGALHFWSRSRQKLWMKGESSGNVHQVLEVRTDCDGDTLLVQVRSAGPTCHLGTESCFDGAPVAELIPLPETSRVVDDVAEVVASRKAQPVSGSYTNYLLEQGIDKIGKKIGEEAAEVIIAAKNRSREELAREMADLWFHSLIALADAGMEPADVYRVEAARHAPKSVEKK